MSARPICHGCALDWPTLALQAGHRFACAGVLVIAIAIFLTRRDEGSRLLNYIAIVMPATAAALGLSAIFGHVSRRREAVGLAVFSTIVLLAGLIGLFVI